MNESDLRRFVILEHDHPFLHWDLLLEDGPVLKSWRLLHPVATGQWIPAEVLPDHRPVYLDFEGPVSGSRGTVKQITSGRFTEVQHTDVDQARKSFRFFDSHLVRSAEYRSVDSSSVEWYFK